MLHIYPCQKTCVWLHAAEFLPENHCHGRRECDLYVSMKLYEMRPIWTGAIGFGLVNIPVKHYSATESSRLDLDMLDKEDHANIHFQRVNASTGKEVQWKNIVKGFKLPNDEY